LLQPLPFAARSRFPSKADGYLSGVQRNIFPAVISGPVRHHSERLATIGGLGGARVPSRKSLRDDTDALAAMLSGVFDDIPSDQRDDAVREFADIHEAHGQGVAEWLVRLPVRLQT